MEFNKILINKLIDQLEKEVDQKEQEFEEITKEIDREVSIGMLTEEQAEEIKYHLNYVFDYCFIGERLGQIMYLDNYEFYNSTLDPATIGELDQKTKEIYSRLKKENKI